MSLNRHCEMLCPPQHQAVSLLTNLHPLWSVLAEFKAKNFFVFGWGKSGHASVHGFYALDQDGNICQCHVVSCSPVCSVLDAGVHD